MPPAAVSVRSLDKAYGEVLALDEVSFEVDPGECVAVLGPNGAGKSTLFSILATLRRPDAGDAFVAGASVVESPGEVRRALGVVFQEPLVSKHLSAREVLVHHARLYGVDRVELAARAEELLGFVGLAARAEDRCGEFSGGMKRRLDLARVLMTRPSVLLLDEPTAGLDLRGRQEVQRRVQDLLGEGTTVLVATHDLDEAHRLANRVVLLDHGRLLAYDTPSRLSRALGQRVVRVELADAGAGPVREVLAAMGEAVATGDALELVLREGAEGGGPSAGAVIDALDEASVPYDRVLVREPNLGDVFLERTGRTMDEADEDAAEVA